MATTRSDPALPLPGRLRARGALGEIRAADLAFPLRRGARAARRARGHRARRTTTSSLLVERTEGWPAGMYLAALWLRELDDPRAGVLAFHGNHRHVADYLSGEVLDILDARDAPEFLLDTSTLGRFSAALCDAVLASRTDSAARLFARARAHQPLPDRSGRARRVVSLPPPLRRAPAARARPRSTLPRRTCSICGRARGAETTGSSRRPSNMPMQRVTRSRLRRFSWSATTISCVPGGRRRS